MDDTPLNRAYWERNQCIAFLSKLWPSCIGIDPTAESEEWKYVVYVETPAGQLSWHIHRDELFGNRDFAHLDIHVPSQWDGHTTEEKYRRLASLTTEDLLVL